MLVGKYVHFTDFELQKNDIVCFAITMNTYAHLMPEVYEKSKLLINDLI